MIHLATDPNASRSGYRPAPAGDEGKVAAVDARRSRSGHAWPFLSQHADRPSRQNHQKAAANTFGS